MTSLRRADSRLSRYGLRVAIALMLALPPAAFAGLALIGVVPGKAAVFSVDGGNPKLVKIGQSWSGIRVLAVDKQHATVEIDGKRQRIALGQHHRSGTSASTDRQQAVLAADPRGHFVVDGAVNGGGVRFILDTGATTVALPGADAVRLGIDYRKGRSGTIDTANGRTTAWLVKLDTVKVGGIELANVDAIVVETGLSIALLGMTFLNRVEMKRDGATMTLIRRY
ncbi:MAG TPA: TIGR02281 family clan AA aspartic protease [Burkholderiales bacterium]